MKPTKPARTLYVCPNCTRTVPARAFAMGEEGVDLQALECFPVRGKDNPKAGTRGGWEWNRRPMDAQERAELVRIHTAIGSRLRTDLARDVLGDRRLSDEAFKRLASELLDEAQEEVARLEQLVSDLQSERFFD